MKRQHPLLRTPALTLACVTFMLTGTALATGIPAKNPLFYSGLLVDTSGTPKTSVDAVTVELWDAETGGIKKCSTTETTPTLTQGRFRIALDKLCVDEIQKNPDLYVEVLVTLPGSATPSKLGRTKIGAVPFAVEPKDAKKWDDAHGWGDHAKAGYIKSYTETDPVYAKSAAASIKSSDVTNWTSAYGWGDHAKASYLKSYSETDPVYAKSSAASIKSTDISNWKTAHGWGNHASAKYLKSYSESDPQVGTIKKSYIPMWNGSALVSSSVSDWGTVGVNIAGNATIAGSVKAAGNLVAVGYVGGKTLLVDIMNFYYDATAGITASCNTVCGKKKGACLAAFNTSSKSPEACDKGMLYAHCLCAKVN